MVNLQQQLHDNLWLICRECFLQLMFVSKRVSKKQNKNVFLGSKNINKHIYNIQRSSLQGGSHRGWRLPPVL